MPSIEEHSLRNYNEPATLLACGCTAFVYKDGSGIEVTFCPLHQTASKLLEACQHALIRLNEVDAFAHRSFVLLDKLDCSTTKGLVGEAIKDATRTP